MEWRSVAVEQEKMAVRAAEEALKQQKMAEIGRHGGKETKSKSRRSIKKGFRK